MRSEESTEKQKKRAVIRRQIRTDGKQILEIQMARQEGNMTEMVSGQGMRDA